MPFVVDASVTASWLLPDETDPRADAAYERLDDDEVLAPSLWWFETRNILVMNERRGRIAGDDARRAFAFLSALPLIVDREPEEKTVLSLVRSHKLTVYDAAYLELALRKRSPLATLDDALAAAARAESVTLIGT